MRVFWLWTATLIILGVGVQGATFVWTQDSCTSLRTVGSAYNTHTIQLSENIVCAGEWVYLTGAHDVTLDLNGHEVHFDTAGGSNARGLEIFNCYDITVQDGRIYRDEGIGEEAGTDNNAMWVQGCYRMLFDSVTFESDGNNGIAVRVDNLSTSSRLHHYRKCTFANNGRSGDNREFYHGAAVRYWGAQYFFDDMAPIDSFHVKFDSCHVTAAWQVGILISNQKGIIRSGSITVDARNEKYDTIYLDNGVGGPVGSSADNCYNIMLTKIWGGSLVEACSLYSGNNYSGSRGIFLEDIRTEDSSGLWTNIQDCYFDVHSGGTSENIYGSLWVFRWRNYGNDNYPWKGGSYYDSTSKYIRFARNTIVFTVDDDPLTTHIGKKGVGLVGPYWQNSTVQGAVNHVKIDSNTVYARSLSSTLTSSDIYEACWGASIFCSGSGTVDTAGSSFRGNTFYASECPLALRYDISDDRFGLRDALFHDFTLGFIDTTDNDSLHWFDNGGAGPHTIIAGGGSLSDGEGNQFYDFTYENGASETDVWTRTTQDWSIAHNKTVGVYVKDTAGNPIESAVVTLRNDVADLVWTETSNSIGFVSGVANYLYDSVGTGADTNYNDFTIKAVNQAETDSTSFTITISPSYSDTTIVLGETQGEEPPVIYRHLRGVK